MAAVRPMESVACLQRPWLRPSLAKISTFSPPTKQRKPPCSSKPLKVSRSQNKSEPQEDCPQPTSPNSPKPDPVKLAFERAKAYKKSKEEQNPNVNSDGNGGDNSEKEMPSSLKIAMEKAREYEKNKGLVRGAGDGVAAQLNSDGSETERAMRLGNKSTDRKDSKKQELKVSSLDFLGLNFADKKQTRGLPPGLVPTSDPFPEGELPEVEIIVGDTSKFKESAPPKSEETQEETYDVYKPKYGGGRNIQSGDPLETAEERAAKEERTRKLIAAYREKVGLKVDPRLKSECEKALQDGNNLMDSGKLNEALGFYEKVMDKMPFKSEVHGLAALQWSICQDSLRRSNEARVMYEKLQTHPDAQVSKKAKQFMFSFQAMEMMKVSSSNFSMTNTGYQNYFDAFVKDEPNISTEEIEVEDELLNQALPYVIFLISSPVLLVLYFAVQKGSVHWK